MLWERLMRAEMKSYVVELVLPRDELQQVRNMQALLNLCPHEAVMRWVRFDWHGWYTSLFWCMLQHIRWLCSMLLAMKFTVHWDVQAARRVCLWCGDCNSSMILIVVQWIQVLTFELVTYHHVRSPDIAASDYTTARIVDKTKHEIPKKKTWRNKLSNMILRQLLLPCLRSSDLLACLPFQVLARVCTTDCTAAQGYGDFICISVCRHRLNFWVDTRAPLLRVRDSP